MENKYGFLPPIIKPEDYIREHPVLGGKIPDEVLQENGNWLLFLPLFEAQKKETETYNCTAFGTTSALEMLMERKLSLKKNYSDRALGIVAGTEPPGNDPNIVAQALRDNGLVKEELLPFSDDLTSPEAYFSPKPLPDNLIEEAKQFTAEFDFKHEWLWSYEISLEEKHKRLKETLKFSPLGVSVNAWQQDEDGLYYKDGDDNHWTVLYGYDSVLNQWLIFDSYENDLKRLRGDYDFGFAKRYWIEKKPQTIITEKKTPFNRIKNWFSFWWNEIIR